MAAQPRQREHRGSDRADEVDRGVELKVADKVASRASVPSPARELQANIEAVYAARQLPVSRLQVYGSVVVFCFAAWWAVYQLALGLV